MRKNGFTLVELSVVLVIIGLLIGSILLAQSMIQTAKIQKVITDLEKYSIAFTNFKLNYKYFPGDDDFFLAKGNKDNSHEYSPPQPFCAPAPNSTLSTTDEGINAWSHLVQANLLDGPYRPYAPTSCGGTDTNISAALGGKFTPAFELDSKASSYYGYKLNVIRGIFSGDYFGFRFNISTYMVIPMESKLGSKINLSGNYPANLGLTNTWGAGKCTRDGMSPKDCNDATAKLGSLVYTQEM